MCHHVHIGIENPLSKFGLELRGIVLGLSKAKGKGYPHQLAPPLRRDQ